MVINLNDNMYQYKSLLMMFKGQLDGRTSPNYDFNIECDESCNMEGNSRILIRFYYI